MVEGTGWYTINTL